MAEFDCKKCLHEKVCALWASRESQDASCFCMDGCDYFTPALSPPNEPLTIEQLRAELEQVKRCIEIVENQRDQMKRERDAAVEDLHKLCPAWKWDGEEG